MKHRVPKKTSNSKGQVFYGTHMYPGLAEYHPKPDVSYRILVEEETIRNMDPTFAGRPVYVMHVDSVDKDVDRVRKDADGWVVESFYNEADGQHWAKFIVVTNRGLNAIRKGYKLSNCYTNTKMAEGGVYNGVSYDYKLKGAEYEHLAIVPDPRYDSKIMTPEEFKAYNEGKVLELRKVANSTSNKGKTMGSALKFFKRESVKNSKHEELASLSVLLPKSNKEFTIQQCVEAADKVESARGKPRVANSQDLIRIENEEITVDDAVEELLTLRNRLAELEDDHIENEDDSEDDEEELDDIENEDDSEDEDPDEVENSASSYRRSDKTQTQRRQSASGKTPNRDQKQKTTKRHKNDRDDFRQESRPGKSQNRRDRSDDDQEQSEGRERARRLRHANQQDRIEDEGYTIDTADRQVARGKELFGR